MIGKLIKLVLCSFVLGTNVALAEMPQGSSSVQFNFGFTRGGMAVGADYENAISKTFGVGAYFRMYPDDTNPAANGINTFGAFIRPHFNRQNWDLYLSPGFGIISLDPYNAGADDETLLGPSLAIGLLYEMTTQISFGVERMSLYSWFGEDDYRGSLSEELLAKFRFVF